MGRPEFCWRFDVNRRRYAKDSGRTSGPIWREHWAKYKVLDETARSYILEHGQRVPKKPDDRTHVFDANRLEVLVWAHENRPRLVDFLRSEATVDQLQDVAAILDKGGN